MKALALRALPITFLIYVIEAVLAVFASWPDGVALSDRLHALALDPPALRELGTLALGVARGHALALGALLVLAPWLQSSWLAMLAEPQSPWRALARGARATPRAWLVALGIGLAFALSMLVLGLAGAVVLNALGALDGPNSRRGDTLVLEGFALLLLVGFYFHVALDLARATALEQRAWRSIRRGLRRALHPATFALALGATLFGVLLPLAAHACSWRLGSLLATMLLQSVLFARLVVRGLWLGRTLAVVRDREVPWVNTSGSSE